MNELKFVKFIDKFNNLKVINPLHVVSIEHCRHDGDITLHTTNNDILILNYSGIDAEKAIWLVCETLRLGYDPYSQIDTDADTEDKIDI